MAKPDMERGVLYPRRLPEFTRRHPEPRYESLARWFWASSWDLPPEVVSEQSLLPYAASNLVVETERITLTGPTTGASVHRLAGRGWAIAALLQPAAAIALVGPSTPTRDAAGKAGQ